MFGDPHVLFLKRQVVQEEARKNSLLDECTPLCEEETTRSINNISQTNDEFTLKEYIESCGHEQLELCQHINLSSSSCRGYLYKSGLKLRTCNKRWFVCDKNEQSILYYSDKNEKTLKGCIQFQNIQNVFPSPTANMKFCIKTKNRPFYLSAPSVECMRIWIDVISICVKHCSTID